LFARETKLFGWLKYKIGRGGIYEEFLNFEKGE